MNKLKNFFKGRLSSLNNKQWLYTLFSLWVKTGMFINLLNILDKKTVTFKRFCEPFLNPIYICFILIVVAIGYLLKGRVQRVFLLSINWIVSFILIFDLWYYRGFEDFISLYLFSQTSNLNNLSDAIISMIRAYDVLFISDLIIITILSFIKKNKVYDKFKRDFALSFILIIASTSFIYYRHYKVDIVENFKNDILFKICWYPKQTMVNLSPIGYHFYHTYDYIQNKKVLKLTDKDKEEIKKWYEDKWEDLPDNKYKGMFKGKNLIVLQVESLENFVINKSINGQEITPNLNKLLKNSLYFSNFHEQVNVGTSSDSDLMTNTSVYPVRNGSTFFRFPDNTYNSMPKIMENMGYSTLAIHPDKGSYWNWMRALTSIGFQKCIDSESFNIDEIIGLGLSDGSYLKQVGPIITKEKQPFYTFMVTLSSHGPFNIQDKYRELKIDKKLDETKLGGYFQSVHYTDKEIGKFIDYLDKQGILDNTVVVIDGDHCGVHKFYQSEVDDINPREDWWLENYNEIPLIIYNKSLQGEEVTTNGGQIDTLPTLCYLMGVDMNKIKYTAMGRNLLNTKEDFSVLNNGKYIGTSTSEKQKEERIKGLTLADKLIRSHYFKK